MANIIRNKYSQVTNTPTSLEDGELAYSRSSDSLFVGVDGDNTVIKIAGKGDVDKLAGIEAGADVTDATNVDAAGAVMLSDTDASTMSFYIDEDAMGSNSATKFPSQQSVKAYVDNAVAGGMVYKGAYDADTNSPDLDTSPSGVLQGDTYTVSVAGTFFTTAVEVGDVLVAEAADAATEAEWTILNRNIDSSAFATAAQGSLADSAVQPSDNISGLTNDSGFIADVVSDTTPQLGGGLDLNGFSLYDDVAANNRIDITDGIDVNGVNQNAAISMIPESGGAGKAKLMFYSSTGSFKGKWEYNEGTDAVMLSHTGTGNFDIQSPSASIVLTANGGNVVMDGITYPSADGTAGQVLTTNGAGLLEFSDSSLDTTSAYQGQILNYTENDELVWNYGARFKDKYDPVSNYPALEVTETTLTGSSITTDATGTIVTGTGTAFTTECEVDGAFVWEDGGTVYSEKIASVDSDTQLTIVGYAALANITTSTFSAYPVPEPYGAGTLVYHGDMYSVNQSGTFYGTTINIGDLLVCRKTGGSGPYHWQIIKGPVVSDTTPQLGGNLDVNGKSIVSASNGDIAITPDGTGSVVLDGVSWPQSDGTADQVLATDGAGNLSWVTNTGGGALNNLVEDTTPQLGGSLDVNGNSIVSVSNGNISITPDGTGKVVLDGLSWPTADGTNGQFLQTDAAGNLSFATALTSYTETNDLSAAVTWANVPDANITESSVTQHEAALSIASTQVTGEINGGTF